VVLSVRQFKLSGRQVETGKKSIFLVKKLKKCQKTAILDQKTIKNEISDLATRKFEANDAVPEPADDATAANDDEG